LKTWESGVNPTNRAAHKAQPPGESHACYSSTQCFVTLGGKKRHNVTEDERAYLLDNKETMA
jgi:hypothetical protein